MSLQARKELLCVLRPVYQQASLGEKTELLNGFIAATRYSRKHAVALLCGTESPRKQSTRQRIYDDSLREPLVTVWHAANNICAKRLIPFLPALLDSLERNGHISLEPSIRARLLSMSAATADRMLREEKQHVGKGISTTTPGNLLRTQIAVRTFADWIDIKPGFLEADLVAHCGGNPGGQFVHTLTMTDIVTGWTELIALLNKREEGVLEAIKQVQMNLPFVLIGLDTDNGGEFINHSLANYCRQQEITFTRSRPYKKNDQAHVEEKNGSVVRRLIGYDRYEGKCAWLCMTDLYRVARLYVNFFQPSVKLINKERIGARVRKTYDKAQTPYQRLLCHPLDASVRVKLEHTFRTLDPVVLLQRIQSLQCELWKTSASAQIHTAAEPQITPNPTLKRQKRIPPVSTVPKRKKGSWRKRKDPFTGGIWEWACTQLEQNPGLGQRRLLNMLVARFPDRVNKGQNNTVSRRLRDWRDAHPEYVDQFPPSARESFRKRTYGIVSEYSITGMILDEAMTMSGLDF